MGPDQPVERDCICADPENCTQPVPGRRCRKQTVNASERWECGALKQGTAGGNEPADCNWPVCGCDPYANKVMAALEEMALLLPGDLGECPQCGGTGPHFHGDVSGGASER
jgi:hypothetical protein